MSDLPSPRSTTPRASGADVGGGFTILAQRPWPDQASRHQVSFPDGDGTAGNSAALEHTKGDWVIAAHLSGIGLTTLIEN
jgi:hypothetical protein